MDDTVRSIGGFSKLSIDIVIDSCWGGWHVLLFSFCKLSRIEQVSKENNFRIRTIPHVRGFRHTVHFGFSFPRSIGTVARETNETGVKMYFFYRFLTVGFDENGGIHEYLFFNFLLVKTSHPNPW